jgi:hypothetical protein
VDAHKANGGEAEFSSDRADRESREASENRVSWAAAAALLGFFLASTVTTPLSLATAEAILSVLAAGVIGARRNQSRTDHGNQHWILASSLHPAPGPAHVAGKSQTGVGCMHWTLGKDGGGPARH